MIELCYVGSHKRTERTAMAEAVRVVEDWWARIGRPDVRIEALSARRLTRDPQGLDGRVPSDQVTLTEAAASLGVTAATLRQQIANGKLRAVKHGRDWYVTPAAVEAYRTQSRRPRP